MKNDDGKWHPCAYLFKGLNDVERNYDIHDKELLGMMHALEAWHHYLEGCKHKFEIWTDHQNLQYFMESKKLNCCKHNDHFIYLALILCWFINLG